MPVLGGNGGKEAEGVRAAWDGGATPDPREISFRRLGASDLTLLYRWLNEPYVSRWWYGEDTSRRGVEEQYGAYVEGREPVKPFLILHGDRPIGYIQAYEISHDEGYARLVDVENSAGVDLFIGEKGFLHRGLGPHVLRRFLAERVFSDPGIDVCVIGPEPKNVAAVRAYGKVGFRFFKTIRVPGEPEPEHLMRLTRGQFEEGNDG